MGNSTPFIMFNVLQFIYIHNKPKFLLYFLFTPYLSVLFDCNCCSYKTVGILPHNINSHIFAFHLPFSRWPSLLSLLSPIQGKYLPSSSSGFHGNHVLSHSLAARRPLLFLPPLLSTALRSSSPLLCRPANTISCFFLLDTFISAQDFTSLFLAMIVC